MPWRILLVDDHPLFREGLKHLIQHAPDLSVSAEAGTAAEAMRLVKTACPDLVILDISLPDKSGLELLPELRKRNPRLPVLMVSMHHKSEHVVRAFQAGAIGYVTKESALENLVAGIRSALAGEFYLDPSMSQDVLKKLLEAEHSQTKVDAKYGSLTKREQEVMRLIAEGLSARTIAERLFISPKTVDNHRANIMRKLGLNNTVDIVRCAARLGLFDLDEWRL